MLKYSYILLLLCCISILIVPVFSQNDTDATITIRGKSKFVATISVPPFFPSEGSESAKTGVFSDIIYRDLELSGYFKRPDNQQFVIETHEQDQKTGEIDFLEWRRIGSSFLVKGKYTLDEENVSAEVFLYDIRTGQRIFGRKFPEYSRKQYRRLAHRISDEIVKYVAQEPGIASTRILYISQQGKSKEVYVMDADGFGQAPLTSDGNLAATPEWGYGASEIYYTSYKEYNPDLWVMRLEDKKAGVVSSYPGFNLSPAWCPETGKIALTLSKDGNSEIYTMDHRGNELKRLTMNRAIDSSPSWSPAGNQLVFTSDRTGSPQIYRMNSDGLGVTRLTRQGAYSDAAVWSPNGDLITFVSRKNGSFHIFTMKPDGTEWIQLTKGSSNNEDPTWAPDGKHIAFTSDRTGKTQIFVINLDGSGLTQLTTEGANQSPSWSPFLKN